MVFDDRILDYEPVKPSRVNKSAQEPDVSSWPSKETDFPKNSAHDKKASQTEVAPLSKKRKSSATKNDLRAGQRGHSFSFVALFSYVAIAYFRPYELVSALSWTVWLPYWLGIAMVVVFISTQYVLHGNFTDRPREVNLVLLLTLTALLSIPLAPSPWDAWDTFNKIFIKTVLLFIIMVNVMRTERRLKLMIFLSFAAGFYMSAIALRDFGVPSATNLDATRAKAAIKNLFGEPNAMALHLVTMIPIAIALFLSSRNVLKKTLYAAGALLMIVGTFATQSRGGFLGIVAAGSVFAWKLGRRNRVLMVAVVVVVLSAAVIFAPGGYGNRMATIIDTSADATGSASSRRELLKRSVIIAIGNPLFGIGIGNFPIVGIRGQVTHNAYTQVAAEMGLPALAFYILFLVAGYKRLRRMELETLEKKNLGRIYFLTVGLQASLVGYMVGSFFLSVAYEWFVYVLVGYAICFQHVYDLQVARGEEVPGRQPLGRLAGAEANAPT